MSDKFLGRWLVSEYVFNAQGDYLGLIKQTRELHEQDNGRIRVTQHCKPEPQLTDHPMGQFRGEWVFELSRNGRFRHYHGPAVIGTGTTWQDGVMTGQGVWPDFGYTFRSYAVLAHPKRQLTGGQFFLPGEVVANIIGVAEPEEADNGYPQLHLEAMPKRPLNGTQHCYTATGNLADTNALSRQIERTTDGFIWHEDEQNDLYFYQQEKTLWRCQQQQRHGFARRFGPALMIDLHSADGTHYTLFEMFDAQTQMNIGLHHHYQHGQLRQVYVSKLKAEG